MCVCVFGGLLLLLFTPSSQQSTNKKKDDDDATLAAGFPRRRIPADSDDAEKTRNRYQHLGGEFLSKGEVGR